MLGYHIRFKDGSYHFKQGVGFPTSSVKEAAIYYSIKEAEKMVWELSEVDAIIRSTFNQEVVKQY